MRKALLLILTTNLLLTCCTKDGETIYQPNPYEEQTATTPLVMVICGPNSLGDRSYCDLTYKGIEAAAKKYGIRTLQLSPESEEQAMTYIEAMFRQMANLSDTTAYRIYEEEKNACDGGELTDHAGLFAPADTYGQAFVEWAPFQAAELGISYLTCEQYSNTDDLCNRVRDYLNNLPPVAFEVYPNGTYRDLYLYCAQHTSGSHVGIYNNTKFGNLYTTGPKDFFVKETFITIKQTV